MSEKAPATSGHDNASNDALSWAAARGEKWRANLSGMEATLAPVDPPLIDALRLDAPYRVADIGCGGGGTALAMLDKAPPGTVIDGFDLSPALIETAQARAREHAQRGASITFRVADMVTAAAPSEPYARLMSRFGIMFFDDPSVAFSNIATWLARGGRFAFAVWGPTVDNAWLRNVRSVVGEIIDIPPVDPDAPGPFRYADASKLIALLERSGFAEMETRTWRGMLPIGGGVPAADAATFGLASFSSFGELLTAAGPEAYRAARESLTAHLAQYERDGAVHMDASVHIITGTRAR